MVVSVAKATSADYYTGNAGVAHGPESYYLDAVADGEPAGQWAGTGSERLGLAGEVSAEHMESVFSEFRNPITGEAIGNPRRAYRSVEDRLAQKLAEHPDALPEQVAAWRTEMERTSQSNVLGWDATFSVAKSVTVAHTAAHRAEMAAADAGDLERALAFRQVRMGIEDAIHTASDAMIAEAERIAVVRTGRHGGASETGKWEAAPGLVVARFFQHTSRSIDPQLHMHTVVLNRAFMDDGGTDAGAARALDAQDFLAQKHALGAVADRVLEEAMTRMGFGVELRPDQMARELTVVPTEVADLFSTRSRQMSPKVAELAEQAQERLGRDLTDLELWRLRETAVKATRAGKHAHAPETTAEMLERWEAATVAEVGSGLDSLADRMLGHIQERTAAGLNTPAGAPEFDPDAVIAESVAAVAQARASWQAADLQLEIARRLPSLGGLDAADTVEVLHRLTDRALAGPLVRQVSGRRLEDLAENVQAPVLTADVQAGLESDPFTAPSSRRYAAADTLIAEDALRRAAIERGGHRLDADQVRAWLDEHAPTISADQAAAVIGLAATDAQLAVLVGPAGTGKSFTAGAFANAWADLTARQARETETQAAGSEDAGEIADGAAAPAGFLPGRVFGLAESERATLVLQGDGLEHARNVSKWLNTQERLSEGRPIRDDRSWQLRSTDVVLVDEASMVTTDSLNRIRALAEAAGARVVLTGDPRQLGAVEAGGVLGLLDGHAETYTLTQVRRFTDAWEAGASLRLREGDAEVLEEYDRHGRLLSHDSHEQAITAAATAAVADRLDGRSVVVIAGTNDEARTISTAIRAQLIDLGLVDPADQVALGHDGGTAGVGDLIVTRQNDYGLGVHNRGQYVVTAVAEDGSLTVTPADRPGPSGQRDEDRAPITGDAEVETRVLPAGYVAEHVQLGYAATVHASQGMTVDAGHFVTGGGVDAATVYVGMTRGRLRNTAHVALANAPQEDTRPGARTGGSGEIRLSDDSHRPSARVMIEQALAQDSTARAATVEAERDLARLTSMDLLAGRYEAVVRSACRERLDRHLDQLTADGVLAEGDRARLAADQGTEHLARLLRAVEQAGGDPRQTLNDAVSSHRLSDAKSVAQVVSHRITRGEDLPLPAVTADARVPADIGPDAVQHLQQLAERMDQRRAELAEDLAAHPPGWALEAFGPVPTAETPDATGVAETENSPQSREGGQRRRQWLEKAGTVAGHREATGWDDQDQAIGTMPGVHATERRAWHAAAWQALGRPDDALDESALSEGRLRVRVRAAQAELGWAPPHAHSALRAAETGAEEHRQAAALARARAEAAKQAGDVDQAQQALDEADLHDRDAAARAASIEHLTEVVETRDGWAAGSNVTRHLGERALTELQRRGIHPEVPADPAERVTAEEWLRHERAARESDDAHRDITETDVINRHEADLTAPGTPAPDDLDQLPEAATPHEQQAAGDARDEQPAPDGQNASIKAETVKSAPQEKEKAVFAEHGWGSTAAHAVLPEDLDVQGLTVATATARMAADLLSERNSQDGAHTSEADRDDAGDGGESYETGRRRRDSADLVAAQHDAAAAAGNSDGWETS